jgi:hypothetical protein
MRRSALRVCIRVGGMLVGCPRCHRCVPVPYARLRPVLFAGGGRRVRWGRSSDRRESLGARGGSSSVLGCGRSCRQERPAPPQRCVGRKVGEIVFPLADLDQPRPRGRTDPPPRRVAQRLQKPRTPRLEIATPRRHGRPSTKPTTQDSHQAASADPPITSHTNKIPKECWPQAPIQGPPAKHHPATRRSHPAAPADGRAGVRLPKDGRFWKNSLDVAQEWHILVSN